MDCIVQSHHNGGVANLDQIGRYRIERRLGAGAFATVWLAEDDVLESQVAIKVLAENWAHNADVRARFEQEAQMLRRADSERLIRIHDFGELPDGRPYQVMTYAPGGTLAERLASGPMPVRLVLRTAAAIARATSDLHKAGVLHRDLKPSNVLFGADGQVLVADLGLAKAIAYASGFTVVAGTPGYMAPEQSRPGEGLDVRADVHAIGAMTYQMLTGTTPGRTLTAPSKLRPSLDRQVDRVVLRALAAQRDRRWPTAAALADALDDAASRKPRNRSLMVRAVGIPIALAAVTLPSAAAIANPTPSGWVRVTDASGTVSVAVPRAWAGQMSDGGWDPAAVGLVDGHSPGLTVTADPASTSQEYAGGPLVFAGTAPGITAATLPVHTLCIRQPDRTMVAAGASARVTRWTACAGTGITFDEVLLGDLYVQVKQDGGPDRTDQILRAVHS
jgi:hypothetical protein